MQHVDKKKLQAAVADFESGRSPFAVDTPVDEIILQLFFSNFVWRSVEMINDQPDMPGVTFLCPLAHTGKLKGPDCFDIPLGLLCFTHGDSPFPLKSYQLRRRTTIFFI